jgi:hypothetical protein
MSRRATIQECIAAVEDCTEANAPGGFRSLIERDEAVHALHRLFDATPPAVDDNCGHWRIEADIENGHHWYCMDCNAKLDRAGWLKSHAADVLRLPAVDDEAEFAEQIGHAIVNAEYLCIGDNTPDEKVVGVVGRAALAVVREHDADVRDVLRDVLYVPGRSLAVLLADAAISLDGHGGGELADRLHWKADDLERIRARAEAERAVGGK